MKYRIKQIHCRPWTLNGLSLKLIESHYENNYGGAMRRLNAITEQLASLDFANTPGHVLNGLKREELVAKFARKYAELKAVIADMSKSEEERYAARLALQRLPRNAYPSRLRNR